MWCLVIHGTLTRCGVIFVDRYRVAMVEQLETGKSGLTGTHKLK